MWTRLVAKFGLFKVIGVIVIVVLLFGWGIKPRITSWWYENKAERLEKKLEVTKADLKVSQKNEKQTEKAGEITAETVEAQDAHVADVKEATTNTVEVIHERIKIQPVVVPVPDDPIVRNAVDQAIGRAKTSQDRLRRKT